MIIVHYEVYVLEGRGWMLHARFPRPERDNALAEAKELEQSLNIRVRVVRETYYTDDNTFEESEIYLTAGAPSEKPKVAPQQPRQSAKPAPRQPGTKPNPAPVQAQGSAPRAKGAARVRSSRPVKTPDLSPQTRQVLVRLMAASALGVAAALLGIKLTPEAILLLWRFGINVTVTPESYNRLLLLVFVITFLLVAVPLALRLLPRRSKGARSRSFRVAPAADQGPAPAVETWHDPAVKRSLDKLAAQALAVEEGRVPQPRDRDAEPEDADDLPALTPVPDDVPLPEIRPGPDERDRNEVGPASEDKKEKKEKRDAASAENMQPTVMRFLDGAIAQAKTLVPNMDSFTKFALHLYMAGAVESLCDFRKLGEGSKAKLMEMALESLGTRGEIARKFYEKLEEYLLEPRYLGVVQAGRDAMADFMLGDAVGAHRALRDAIVEWTRKSDKKAQIVTVMFTDMVGSTDMTQARGDAAAQEVVRRHNSIVRGALAQFGGKEIKHTGDGIMASFATAAAAAEASISIQRQVNQHNRRLPNQALHLRIGLNAGEPIEEEDDLFGATVQLAARVCAATNADQVLCTAVVKDLTVGKGAATFRPIGEKHLKGFRDPISLFEVQWKG